MKSTPIYVFENKNSLLINEVPIHGAIVVIDFDGVTKNITKLSNNGVTSSTTIEQFIAMEDNWAFLGKPGELELIEENSVEGWRLYKRDENNYGNIGKDAVDFNITDGGFPESGATGERSFAAGFNSHAMGTYSFCEGYTNLATVELITGPIGGGGQVPEGAVVYYGVPEGAVAYYGVPEGAVAYYGVPEATVEYDLNIYGEAV
jgi:hypothetical protein